ncbi:MAG TPA: DUF4416 family protein [Candidatus Desulfaltia sp.]|nr:DUF4416 family protein [Candidatus Desulfaltia sp.]
MAEAKPFAPGKLVVGIISSQDQYFARTGEALIAFYGPIDLRSPIFPFNVTDYYDKQMGKNLRRLFMSFAPLIPPESLSEIKVRTNSLEEEMREAFAGKSRLVNIDPGILTGSALFMATAKDFAHRVPLRQGIYAHLELLFTKTAVHFLSWTYPDFRQEGYQNFFLEVRRIYLEQLRQIKGTGR